ncbi:hypothetical protein [Leucobacter chromiireducens]|uniref:Secreted protein n=1 Tax=Leucobacter chromiireducens subsp. solipictus TaxID=398235 RepID=A0ABS1SD77_9MICO|nr:hypothetical protein [Leucobacter chromiireducens]MBL3678503.1 hypothetical protein [Leucobacter chromiireducens subsp. solipictus]
MSVYPRTSTAPRRTLALAATGAALLWGLLGCASGAGTGSADAADAPQPAGDAAMTDDEYMGKLMAWERKLAQCFRDKGIDVTDPTPEGGWADVTPEMQALSPECEKEIGAAPVRALSAEEKAEGARQQLEYDTKVVECLRALGHEMPDPRAGEVAPAPPAGVTDAELTECNAAAVAG